MKTLFDIGDEISITMKGKVIEYSASKNGDCYIIELTHPMNQRSRVYLSSSDLYDAKRITDELNVDDKEENVMTITAKIESLNHIPKTCSECKLQSDDRKCLLILDVHQSCPVTFYPELFNAATEKQEDGTTVIDVFKTGRRCLCPLEEKRDEG